VSTFVVDETAEEPAYKAFAAEVNQSEVAPNPNKRIRKA